MPAPPISTRTDPLFPSPTLFRSPGLDQWLKLHYMPVGAPGWGSAADTLELAAADFGLAELARPAGDTAGARQFRERSRSEEHTSELQSLMRISYAVFCLQKTSN